ncbi:hypothetical protein HYPSUDRAFT_83398 [Hypholoma sublateritium FD-334 SS-4]|uniref:BZIP domain-containing protein n=1 Tax=Hypholoma sublateritium (strain FD-334 SS-4) TaxID=945553 RepID=A0A0D2P9W1_HYPSF|nr:hypothetical protein HYPSUDRAFT_83398 [Hypholoma sublateritium FD-334 SS-4]
MTRGRKKDLTIPPTRSLTQQRDYRARKANYVSELESHCRRVEEENAELKKELVDVRARLANPVVVHPETAQASQELLYNLAMASVSLTKFQQLAFPNIQQPPQPSFPSNHHSLNLHSTLASSTAPPQDSGVLENHPRVGRKRLFTESEEEPIYSPTVQAASPGGELEANRSDSSEESCCGGYIDCDTLCGDSVVEGKEQGGTISRVSGMRSTFNHRVDTP